MKSPRFTPVLALIVLAGLVAPLSASEPAAPALDAGLFYPTATPTAGGLCPTYHCPIYYPNDCSCDWIECPNGWVVCGVWNGAPTALQKVHSTGAGQCSEASSGR